MVNNNKVQYLLLISIHGLIRGHDLELGRDADTGGQTKYVVDLARALAEQEQVHKVDLVTRQVCDPTVHDDYASPVEVLTDKLRIVRISAGPDEYLPKEQLWDHLDSFMDNLTDWLNSEAELPSLIHSHYADAGYVGVRLANLLSVPLIHTGHSLGRDKRKRLLASGLSGEQLEQTYHIGRRIDAEEEVLENADLVITSTHNEIDEQYGLYNYYDSKYMRVIPPGTDLNAFHPPGEDEAYSFSQRISHFLDQPQKPLILTLSRPDERKNIHTLLEAYGESASLQEAANLLIVAGNREDIRDMDPGVQSVLTDILLTIDNYDLYGKVAVPKRHRPDEVAQIYRLVAGSRGVFINPALTEPFGLTLLEAAASGVPVVATENGGPVDIIANCQCGTLIDPLDKEDITAALLKYLTDAQCWQQASRNGIKGVRKHYSWQAHAENYIDIVTQLEGKYRSTPIQPTRSKSRYRNRAIVSDLDQNLIGDTQSLKHFIDVIQENRRCVSFGIATGRRLDSALAVMKKYGIPRPDIFITSLGTSIHYGRALTEDLFWTDHIDHDWKPGKIRRLLAELPGLVAQPKNSQSPFKISYFWEQEVAPSVEAITALIRQQELSANVLLSFGQFLDIIPTRASKGQALRYVAQRLDIPLEHMLVAGGSGADEDMMRGNTLAVVVGNRHNEELSQLVDVERIYFASQAHASGILEAIEHYQFFDRCRVPDEQ